MTQSIASQPLSRVNRRFLFLAVILAGLSAVLIYTAISRSSDSGGGGAVAASVPVVVAKASIPAGTTITSQMLDVRLVSQNAVAADAFTTVDAAVGEVVRYPIAANEQLLVSKITSAPAIGDAPVRNFIETGKRALGVRTAPVIGAGGLVVEGDHVDVFWVPSDSETDVTGAQLIAEDVEVLAVDQTIIDIPATAPGLQDDTEAAAATTGSGERIQSLDGIANPAAATVTLMLTPEEIQRVFCGEETGELRLAVRAFGDHSPTGLTPVTCIILGTDQ